MPELRASRRGTRWTLRLWPSPGIESDEFGDCVESTSRHELMQKCHRVAIHIDAGGHGHPGKGGRAWAVESERPLSRVAPGPCP